MNGGTGTDYYIAPLNTKSNLTINDKSGYDALLLSANYKNLRLFFNVDSSGNVLVNDNQNSDNLIVFNNTSLTAANLKNVLNGNGVGAVNINNYFAQNTSGNSYTSGSGAIEYVQVSGDIVKNYLNYANGGNKNIGTINMNSWINSIAESVSGWLAQKGYDSSLDVLNSANSSDVNALLKLYVNQKCNVSYGGLS